MHVFLIAGEPSGDRLGAAAMRGLRRLVPEVRFSGIGGDEMARQGLTSLFAMSDLSVMGLTEVLPRLRHLFRRRDQTVEAILADPPDVLLTIDSPDFCLRVAKAVRARAGVRIVHYVAPSVWAWRPGRAARMAPHVDQVLALLPFEPPYMEAAGIPCDFVGHPVVSDPQATAEEEAALREELGIGAGPMILALPGSRAGEVARLADRFGETLSRVCARHPGARVVLPAGGAVADLVREKIADWVPPPLVLLPRNDPDGARKRAALAAADVALAASGTVSLELAAAGTPMVIGYDSSWTTRQIAKRMLLIDRVCLVNLVTDSHVVPEFIGEACRPGPMADALCAVLEAPGPQRRALDDTMRQLGRDGEDPGLRAARAILSRL
ncbi:lipid-A-disaccharide synthase [Wenxinia saemankumensis]|uniref:lipid-A-disaccharide synthase n=1 Tax=Wenxinia saemankumensis TaxID=1447782 RepID=UPI0009354777|nr:lipid-A-disaccharide synthase [Wenxinia saemankumensis]